MLNKLYKSVLDMDRMPVVICDLAHTIVYMNNAAAKNYEKWGGFELMGQNLKDCHSPRSGEIIDKVVAWFKEDKANNMIHTEKSSKAFKDIYMVALRDENGELIGYYEKHELREPETAERYDFSKSLV